MATKAKPTTARGAASAQQQLKVMREFPGLSDELMFARNLVNSLKDCIEEDESNHTINQSGAQKLLTLLRHYEEEFSNRICRQMIGDELAEANVVPVLMKYMNILTDDGSDYPMDGYNCQCYKIIRSVAWNFTDASINLCKEIGRKGMLEMLLCDMKYFQDTFKTNDMKRFIVRSAMGIFNNCSSVSENVKYFRKINAVTTVAWYATNAGTSFEDGLSTSSMMTLSYIVDEQKNDELLADESIIQTFLDLLEEALESSDGRCKNYSGVEVARALTRLANNDKNSATLVKKGILNSLLKMMSGSEEDKFVATEAVWALAFADVNKNQIAAFKHGKIMELLQKFSKSQSADLQNAAKGALWVLELVKKTEAKQQQSKPCKSKHDGGHVMISYQWDSQDTMIKVRDILQSEGYKVWMDVDNMSGSILESMAKAVEGASVVLVCLSQKYNASRSCRTEGEYVYRHDKPIVPILVEENYQADGWLGALVGMKLYFDLSDHKKFKNNISKLIKELSSKK